MFASKIVVFPTLSLPGLIDWWALFAARIVPFTMAAAVCGTYPWEVI